MRIKEGTGGQSSLPHAMYHGHSDTGISEITSALRNGIEANVWSQAIVLIMSSENWSMSPA
jgi:hypothetical protein